MKIHKLLNGYRSRGALALVATAFLTATALVEEQKNLTHFSAEYVVYRNTTRWFVLYLF
ncbi:hypothetical protein L0128_05815 [candidate division KSB1 bacterium]|nr:hypothetical protein [candidate division KSB1 bacterium]